MNQTNALDELISAFECRARKVARDLTTRYDYVPCERYAARFVALHTDHIRLLRSGDFSRAYEHLQSIGRLSQRLEREEHMMKHRAERPKIRLKFRAERFRRGPMVCCYLAGDFREFSPKFDTSLSKIMTAQPSLLKLGTWSWSHGQRDAAQIYNRLLGMENDKRMPVEESF